MPHSWSPSDVVMILTALFGGLCSLVAAIKATKSDNKSSIVSEKADINGQKLDEIHTLTNGNLSKTQEELDLVKKRAEYQDKLILELADCTPPGCLDDAKKRVEAKLAEVGNRRKSDLESINIVK